MPLDFTDEETAALIEPREACAGAAGAAAPDGITGDAESEIAPRRGAGEEAAPLMPLLTIGQAFAAKVHLIVWCKRCLHRFEPDTAELVEQHGGATTVMVWARWLRCSQCGARDAEFVVSGAER